MAAEPLADPPWLQHLLFESPYELGAVFGVAAVVALLWARYRDSRRAIKAAGVCLLLCLIVIGLTYLVQTDRERLTQLTRRLVHLTVPLDIPAMRDMFDPQATLCGPDGEDWLNLDEILGEVKGLNDERPIMKQTILRIKAQVEPNDQGKTLVRLRTHLDVQITEQPFQTLWLFEWRQSDDDRWLVTKVWWLRHPDPTGFNPTARWR